MTSRLIKQGTKRAEGIQHFLFKEDFKDYTPSAELEREDISGNPANPHEADTKEKITGISAVDTEKLEAEAYHEGFQKGETAGREDALKEMEVTMQKYADSIREIGRIRSSLYAQTEKEVVQLALEIAKKIVNREIQADRNIIRTLVRVALSRVTEKKSVTVRLNPLDYKFLMENIEKLDDEGWDVSLQSDNSIEQGGCLVETGCGDIDARIGEQFREVENAFFGETK